MKNTEQSDREERKEKKKKKIGGGTSIFVQYWVVFKARQEANTLSKIYIYVTESVVNLL